MTEIEWKAWADALNTTDNNMVLIKGTEEVIGYVESFTPATVTVIRGSGAAASNNATTFWKKNGELKGEKDRWHHVSIAPLTPEKRTEINARNRRRNAIYRLQKFIQDNSLIEKISTENLEAALECLKKGQA